jgi:glycosyltransferase involved in cell wall biosynthesis
MKIVAHLGVKDEVELIERSINHLRAIGVDLIIACDVNSGDGTYEILEKHRSDDRFWVYRLSDPGPDIDDVWTRTAMAIIKSAGADFVLFLDADEFWIPASGCLKTCHAIEQADVLSVRRYSVPLTPNGPAMPEALVPERYQDLLLVVEEIPDFDVHLRENVVTSVVQMVDDKVMARPEYIAGTTTGGHDILQLGSTPLRRTRPGDLVIAHLPLTTRSRFRAKIHNIRESFRMHERLWGELGAWHWRRWLSFADQGRLDEEFDRNVYDSQTITAMRREGVIRSAAELFLDLPLPLG